MYLDFVVKKLAEVFVKNVLICGAAFFGEKFIVEFLSRKAFDKLVTKASLWITNRSYETSSLFHLLVCTCMLSVLALEFWILFIM
jgi:hypothetical protein